MFHNRELRVVRLQARQLSSLRLFKKTAEYEKEIENLNGYLWAKKLEMIVNAYAFKVSVGGVQAYLNRTFSRGRNAMDLPSRKLTIEKVKWCVGIYQNWNKVCLKYRFSPLRFT